MSSISSTSSSSTRITGAVSGLDTDSIVAELMEAERIPLNKLYQKKQLAEWRQDAYREMSNAIRAFNDKYFNILNKDSCMFSESAYSSFSTTVSNASAVKVTTSSDSTAGTHSILVSNLATSAVYKSNSAVTKDITASSAADFSSASGKALILSIDGEETTVTIDSEVKDISSLQSAIDNAVGSGKVQVSENSSGCLVIAAVADSGVYAMEISGGTSSALSSLGFSDADNLSNTLDTFDTLEEISEKLDNPFSFDTDGKLKLTINDIAFEFEKTDTLSSMMQEINDSDAAVTMKYDKNSDTFTITANKTGAGDRISLLETGSNFLSQTGISDNYTAGEDSVVYLDGRKLTRSSNSIVADNITYDLLSESSEEVSVSISSDTNAVYEKIESFVNDYNTLINTINSKISEEYDSDYPPLTSDQKEEMSEDEIENWEEKAKTGLLHNDSILEDLLGDMRTSLYQSISGVSKSLYNIGITTSTSYSDKGKLVIDEEKLKAAIESKPEEVMDIFCKESETHPGTTGVRTLSYSERSVRTSEEGIAYRLFDSIQDSISTYRDSSGKKGALLEKAGMEDDASATSNTLYNEIEDYEDSIEKMLEKLDDKEDQYYKKFSTMETYISNMNSQLSALQSILG